MEGLEYREDYAGDPVARAAFHSFLIDLHGLDLTLWEERVGWDPDFVLFSFFDGDEVVASTAIYSLAMILGGTWVRAAQISSVGTREPWRRRGLNAELTRRALAWAKRLGHRGTFLFADADATEFYTKQGFAEQAEWIHTCSVRSASRPGSRNVTYDRDEALIRRLVESRTPVSEILGARSPKLELFHLLYENAGELRYVEELDLLVASERDGEVLHVYDLIGPDLPKWSEIEPFLVGPATRTISFAITPDRLGLTDAVAVEDRSSRLHVLPDEGLIGGRGIVPFTAHA